MKKTLMALLALGLAAAMSPLTFAAPQTSSSTTQTTKTKKTKKHAKKNSTAKTSNAATTTK